MKILPTKIIFSTLFVLFLTTVNAQDTIFYNVESEKVDRIELAKWYKVISLHEGEDIEATETSFYIDGTKKYEVSFINYEDHVRHGVETFWNEDGSVKSIKNFQNGKPEGSFMTFWENGKPKRHDVYRAGEVVEGTCLDSLGNEVKYYPFFVAPEFPGGKEKIAGYMIDNVKYPRKLRRKGIQGKVFIKFTVNTEGKVCKVKALNENDIHPDLKEEAIRVISAMPTWKPAVIDGELGSVLYTIPVVFQVTE